MNKTILAIPLAAVLAVSMIVTPAAYAEQWKDFDITDFGINGDGDLFITVAGTAGGTTPNDLEDVYAYLWVTNVGIVAVTSHIAEDSGDVGDDLEWHAHILSVSDGCVTGETDAGVPVMDGDTITLSGTGATSVDGAASVQAVFNDDFTSLCVKRSLDPNP
jgi:hypothetical protein